MKTVGASQAEIRDDRAGQPLCFDGKNQKDNATLDYYQRAKAAILFTLQYRANNCESNRLDKM